ncbi:hypothetical protein, partial [Streptomyces sp. NPDC048489]|uniref:hypothetical protein n=1 Tax=Streptomyces sp. NPDC048489 TaxID=3154504 RepID=UPI003447151C
MGRPRRAQAPRGSPAARRERPGSPGPRREEPRRGNRSDGCVDVGGRSDIQSAKAVVDWLNGRARA